MILSSLKLREQKIRKRSSHSVQLSNKAAAPGLDAGQDITMIGDTLLDYVHVSASPTVLFDDRGDILYVNTSLSRNDWGASAVEQLASTVKASLKNLPPRCSTSRIKSDVARTGEFYPSLASEEASRYAGESNNDGASTDDNNTPGPSDVLQTTQWRLTASSCQRILAIAQESKEEQFPDYSPEEMQTLKATVPVVNVPWRKQKRFNGLVSGGGEMGDLVRNFDWSKHPLGAIETWPQARVEMVSLLLRSPVPMTAYQEADAFVIYNDAYRQVLGPSKHPRCTCKCVLRLLIDLLTLRPKKVWASRPA